MEVKEILRTQEGKEQTLQLPPSPQTVDEKTIPLGSFPGPPDLTGDMIQESPVPCNSSCTVYAVCCDFLRSGTSC